MIILLHRSVLIANFSLWERFVGLFSLKFYKFVSSVVSNAVNIQTKV